MRPSYDWPASKAILTWHPCQWPRASASGARAVALPEHRAFLALIYRSIQVLLVAVSILHCLPLSAAWCSAPHVRVPDLACPAEPVLLTADMQRLPNCMHG